MSTCPVKSVLNILKRSNVAPKDAASCPYLNGNIEKKESVENCPYLSAANGEKGSALAGKCPLGFGTSSGPKFTMLHCTLCRSLMYECTKLEDCGHCFCKFCIEKFQDCPLCGKDINGRSPDKELQEVVDMYVEVHSKRHTLWEVDSGMPKEKVDDPNGMERSVATFYLHMGLRSYMGGNLEAAKARLDFCLENIEEKIEERQEDDGVGDDGSNYCLLSKAGAVCGSLGDCCRRLQDTEAALEYYCRSISHLKAAAGSNEAATEVCVSLNKLGDLHFCMEDILAARNCYAEALDIREKRFQESKAPPPEQVLELAVSLAKVADADKVLHRNKESEESFVKARGLVKQIERSKAQLAGKQAAMFENLMKFLC